MLKIKHSKGLLPRDHSPMCELQNDAEQLATEEKRFGEEKKEENYFW
jgi:hypothetical protein